MNMKPIALAAAIMATAVGGTAVVKANTKAPTQTIEQTTTKVNGADFANALKAQTGATRAASTDFMNASQKFLNEFNSKQKAEACHHTADDIQYIKDTKEDLETILNSLQRFVDGQFTQEDMMNIIDIMNENKYVESLFKKATAKAVNGENPNDSIVNIYHPLFDIVPEESNGEDNAVAPLYISLIDIAADVAGQLKETLSSMAKLSVDGTYMDNIGNKYDNEEPFAEGEENLLSYMNEKLHSTTKEFFVDNVNKISSNSSTNVKLPTADKADKTEKVYTQNGIVIHKGGKTYDLTGKEVK